MNPSWTLAWVLGLGVSTFQPLGAQVKVAAGTYHTLALDSAGRVWVWGLNEHGQLGDGTTQDRPLPYPSHPPVGMAIRALAGGEGHSILLSKDGRVFACGRNDRGQLGTGSGSRSTTWVEVKGLDRVIQVACGPRHTYALQADGAVWGWGDNRQAQIAVVGESVIRAPRMLPLKGIKAIVAGATHAFALTEAGEVWGWGEGREGALGPGVKGLVFPPVALSFLPPVSQVAAGSGFSLALTREGKVLAWGRNDHGQLGDGTQLNASSPKAVLGLVGITFIGAGMGHGLAQGARGKLWSWGDNNMGQLGHGAPSYATHPMLVNLPEGGGTGEPWAIAVGGFHTLIYRSDKKVFGFGYNEFNQLGDWSYQNRRSPVQVRKGIP